MVRVKFSIAPGFGRGPRSGAVAGVQDQVGLCARNGGGVGTEGFAGVVDLVFLAKMTSNGLPSSASRSGSDFPSV